MRFLLLAAEETAAHGAAAGGAEHAEVLDLANWLPGVTTLVVFLLAFGFLYLKVWPPIVKGLDDRQKKIREEIEAAEEARGQATAALEEYERSLADARQQAAETITQAKADARAVADELRQRNESELAEMKERATREIENAKRQAIVELHAETATLAADIASKILKREITVEDQKRLIDESLEEMATS
jgi:F-type H+-transporting ATPase subunit b